MDQRYARMVEITGHGDITQYTLYVQFIESDIKKAKRDNNVEEVNKLNELLEEAKRRWNFRWEQDRQRKEAETKRRQERFEALKKAIETDDEETYTRLMAEIKSDGEKMDELDMLGSAKLNKQYAEGKKLWKQHLEDKKQREETLKRERERAEKEAIINSRKQLVCFDDLIELYEMLTKEKNKSVSLTNVPFNNFLYNIAPTRNGFAITCSNGRELSLEVTHSDKNEMVPVSEDRSETKRVYHTYMIISFSRGDKRWNLEGEYASEVWQHDYCDIDELALYSGGPGEITDWDKIDRSVLFSSTEMARIKKEVEAAANLEATKQREAEEIRRLALELSSDERERLLKGLRGKSREIRL